MTEKEFEMLIKRTIQEHIGEYIPESEIDPTPHKFSRKFERKMNKLMGKPVMSGHLSAKRIIIYVTAALIAACIISLSIGAAKEGLRKFITNVFDNHTDVMSADDEDAPHDFSDRYEITADMSDFELVDISENEFKRKYTYRNEYCFLKFEQYIKEYYDISVNTEGYEIEIVFINGYEGCYVDMSDKDAKYLAWDNGDYILEICPIYYPDYDFSKSRLMEIANSVQKAE